MSSGPLWPYWPTGGCHRRGLRHTHRLWAAALAALAIILPWSLAHPTLLYFALVKVVAQPRRSLLNCPVPRVAAPFAPSPDPCSQPQPAFAAAQLCKKARLIVQLAKPKAFVPKVPMVSGATVSGAIVSVSAVLSACCPARPGLLQEENGASPLDSTQILGHPRLDLCSNGC